MSRTPGRGDVSGLPGLTPELLRVLQPLLSRVADAEARVQDLERQALRRTEAATDTVSASRVRVTDVRNPEQPGDAVNLQTMRSYVQQIVEDRVASIPAAVPTPTPAGTPTGTFSAAPTTLPVGGGSVTLTWTSVGATTAAISPGIGNVVVNGSRVVQVTTTTTFTLTLVGGGQTTTLSVTVTVAGTPPPVSPTGTFSAAPTSLPAGGGQTTLTWTSDDADTASITPNVGSVDVDGSRTVNITATTTFRLILVNPTDDTTLMVTVQVAATPPPPTGALSVLGRGFARNGVRYDWRGMTSFPLLWYYLNGFRSTALITLDFCQAQQVSVPRILLSMASAYWDINKGIRPSAYPNYAANLATFLADCAARNICPQLVIFGDCALDMNTPVLRLAFVQQIAQFIRAGDYAAFMEIANEASVINVGVQESVDLCSTYLAIDPGRQLTPGGGHGDNGSTPGSTLAFNIPPSTHLVYQAHRGIGQDGWEWVLQHPTYPPVAQTVRPPVEEEPMNAGNVGSPEQFDAAPAHWYGFALTSRFMRFSATFHFDYGFREGGAPTAAGVDPSVASCFFAWKQGLDAIDFDYPGELWGFTASGPYQDSAVTSLGGARLILGRHDGSVGRGVVLGAPPGWVPTAAPGWTVTVISFLGDCLLLSVTR